MGLSQADRRESKRERERETDVIEGIGKIYTEALKCDDTVFGHYLLAHRYHIVTGELIEC